MLKRTWLSNGGTLVLPLTLAAFLAVRCGNNDPGAANNTTSDESMNAPTSATTSDAATGAANTGTAATGTTGSGYLDPNGSGVPGAQTPTEERTGAMNAMNGLRATLMAELEQVRARLNVGTRPEAEAKADQERAAELAQGLERVDRALAAMGSADDAMWAEMRTTQLKEVDDVRAWLANYKEKRAGEDASAAR